MEYAQFCAESCEKYNLPYEFVDAVEFLECREAFKSVGVKKINFIKTEWETAVATLLILNAGNVL